MKYKQLFEGEVAKFPDTDENRARRTVNWARERVPELFQKQPKEDGPVNSYRSSVSKHGTMTKISKDVQSGKIDHETAAKKFVRLTHGDESMGQYRAPVSELKDRYKFSAENPGKVRLSDLEPKSILAPHYEYKPHELEWAGVKS